MKNIFVNLEIAQKLKEIGFEEPCFAFYYEKHLTLSSNAYTELISIENNLVISNFNKEGYISAPTYEQVFKWFREKGFELSLMNEDGYHYYKVTKNDYFKFSGTEDIYEEAREQLILGLIKLYENLL